MQLHYIYHVYGGIYEDVYVQATSKAEAKRLARNPGCKAEQTIRILKELEFEPVSRIVDEKELF